MRFSQSATALFLSTLFLSATAVRQRRAGASFPSRLPGNSTVRRNQGPGGGGNGGAFKLEDMYQGQDFLNEWDFFTGPDPTHGLVDYQSKQGAVDNGLAFVQDDGTTVLAVDDKTVLGPGQSNRKSVRISTKKTYNSGLFIADFWAMPHGCSVWPAWWSVGPNWPGGGEIDVIEGVHNNPTNQMTLHTSEGCKTTTSFANNNGPGKPSQSNTQEFTAKVLGTQCASSGADNSGCAFLDSDTQTFGHGFNIIAGGVFAHLWNNEGIKIWHFPRTNIPKDIQDKQPDPSTWGTPAAFWSPDGCDMQSHFFDHVLTIDTTLCGDFAGATYGSSGCPGTCEQAVKDPNNFTRAKWMINYIAVYQN